VTRRKEDREAAAPPPARVLVVDDDRVDRMAVRRILARAPEDFEVHEADGVLAAIERVAGAPFDCVVLDYNLPDGDGLTFLRGLRTAGIEVPVVMLTGQADTGVALDLLRSGAAAYIPKAGLSADVLLTTLRDALAGR
jgi:CheY-like chemotaxis protein